MLDSLVEIALMLALIAASQLRAACGWTCPGLISR